MSECYNVAKPLSGDPSPPVQTQGIAPEWFLHPGVKKNPQWRVGSLEPMFPGENDLFSGQIPVFFGQNRVQILITPVNSAGGAGESFGASCFFVRHGVFFSEPHPKSSEHDFSL